MDRREAATLQSDNAQLSKLVKGLQEQFEASGDRLLLLNSSFGSPSRSPGADSKREQPPIIKE